MNYFYVPYSPVATYMNIMQDKNNLSHRILNVWTCDKTASCLLTQVLVSLMLKKININNRTTVTLIKSYKEKII